MSFLIYKTSQSTLDRGVETILIHLTDQHDIDRLMDEVKKGRHAVVEWLLAELYRQTEINRVFAFSADPQPGGAILCTLKLAQPGHQLEVWLAEYGNLDVVEATDRIYIATMDGEKIGEMLKAEIFPTPFTVGNPPYWRKDEHRINVG